MTGQPRLLTRVREQLRVELLAALGAGLLRLISSTVRWQEPRRNADRFAALGEGPYIFYFWHDRQLMMFPEYFRYRNKLVALASMHSDGRIIARILEWLGFRTVAGSSSRGGAAALRQLCRVVREGWDVGISPDGPRGPRHVLKEGAVKLAQLSGAKLVALAYSVEDRWTFNSWDRIFLPKPFTRGVAMVGQPIGVPSNCSEQQFQEALQAAQVELERITQWCEQYEYR